MTDSRSESEVDETPVRVPADRLSAEALAGVIDEFITREGTDYGHQEIDIEEKRRAVRKQIENDEVFIVFDPRIGTVNLIVERDWPGNPADG